MRFYVCQLLVSSTSLMRKQCFHCSNTTNRKYVLDTTCGTYESKVAEQIMEKVGL